MALIHCKHCGKDVSDKALLCPACGQSIMETPEPPLRLCSECGATLPAEASACPNCGCPVEESAPLAPVPTSATELTAPVPAQKKSKKLFGVIAILAAAAICIGGFFFIKNSMLFGDNKIAFEMVEDAAQNFKNPSSVRLVSGTLGVDKDCLFCGISATNGFGARTTGYYYIAAGAILEQENAGTLFTDTDDLNIALINKHLEKSLGY